MKALPLFASLVSVSLLGSEYAEDGCGSIDGILGFVFEEDAPACLASGNEPELVFPNEPEEYSGPFTNAWIEADYLRLADYKRDGLYLINPDSQGGYASFVWSAARAGTVSSLEDFSFDDDSEGGFSLSLDSNWDEDEEDSLFEYEMSSIAPRFDWSNGTTSFSMSMDLLRGLGVEQSGASEDNNSSDLEKGKSFSSAPSQRPSLGMGLLSEDGQVEGGEGSPLKEGASGRSHLPDLSITLEHRLTENVDLGLDIKPFGGAGGLPSLSGSATTKW